MQFLKSLKHYTAATALLVFGCHDHEHGTALDGSKVLPNILFITVDDLGWADLGCYGADLHQTPHIDAFAKSAQLFTQAYAAAAVCSPTRASLLSGKSPAKLNMTIWREAANNTLTDRRLLPPNVEDNLPLEEVTIPEILQKAGYVTAHLGKWHVGDGAHFPESQGFDINIGATIWGCPPTFFYPYRGTIYRSFRYVPDLERSIDGQYELDRDGEYLTDRLTDEAIVILERFQAKPFFINLSYYSVHTPIEAKAELVEYYRNKITTGMSHQNAVYAAMIHSLDENIGKLISKLDDLDLADRTLVILTSDNGGFINEWNGRVVTNNSPLRSGKGSLYEGGIRVPTIVRWPGHTLPGAISPHPITTQDFYPTILEITSIQGDPQQIASFDGTSLVPVLERPKSALGQRELYWHYPHYYPTTSPVSAVRKGDWKLLEFLESGQVELYHLEEDIGEENNLAEIEPQKVNELLKLLRDWRVAMQAPMPHANPEFNNN